MMMLRHAPTSPFVRKVMICAHLKGLADKIALIPTDSTIPDGPHTEANPLGKIPALTLEDGTTIFDSLVVCDYIDAKGSGPKLFPEGDARWMDLTLGAMADGVMDAMILCVYEKRLRPADILHQPWIDRQTGKIERTLAYLEASAPAKTPSPQYGQIALACALGYLDLRAEGKWRATAPNLVAWLDGFAAAVPAYDETKPVV